MSGVNQYHVIATAVRKGLIPPLSNDAADFFNGVGAWAVPPGGGGGPSYIEQWGVPSGVAGSGSVAANGALTLTNALPIGAAYGSGLWLYFPAGACYAGSLAGNYWVVMSSATLGTIYDLTLGAAIPYAPASPPAIVAAGPGAYTGATIEVTVATFTIAAATIKEGALAAMIITSQFSSANNKFRKLKFNGTTIHNMFLSTPRRADDMVYLSFYGSRVICGGAVSQSPGQSSTAHSFFSLDRSADITCTLTLQLPVASENIILEGFRI